MSAITRATVEAVRADIERALGDVAQRHGLQFLRAGRMTYDPDAGTLRGSFEGGAPGALTKEAQRLEQMRLRDPGLPPVGFVMKSGGHSFTITGANATGTKLAAQRDDGAACWVRLDAARRCYMADAEKAARARGAA